MTAMYKCKVMDRLRDKPWLKLLSTNVFCIPERLRRNNPNLFVVFNLYTDRYEIHSIDNKGDSFSLQVPFKELDARTEDFVRKYDLRRHGRKIYDTIDKHNENVEHSIKNNRKNRTDDLARVLHKPVRKLAWYGG